MEEKESRAKETMRIMGLQLWVFNASWFLTYLAVFLAVSALVTAIISSTFLNRSDPLLIFALLFLFTLSLIPFGESLILLSNRFSSLRCPLLVSVSPLLSFSGSAPPLLRVGQRGRQVRPLLLVGLLLCGLFALLSARFSSPSVLWVNRFLLLRFRFC